MLFLNVPTLNECYHYYYYYYYFADPPARNNSRDCPYNKKLSCLRLITSTISNTVNSVVTAKKLALKQCFLCTIVIAFINHHYIVIVYSCHCLNRNRLSIAGLINILIMQIAKKLLVTFNDIIGSETVTYFLKFSC